MTVLFKCLVVFSITLSSAQTEDHSWKDGLIEEYDESVGIMWTLSHSRNIRWAIECDFDGSIIKQLTNRFEDCMDECEVQDECFGFTYQNRTSDCTLRSEGVPIRLYIRNDTCGQKIIRNPEKPSSDDAKKLVAEEACNNYKKTLIPNERRCFNCKNAQQNEFPWMAALFETVNGTRNFVCGGTIISDYYILTAAHCLRETDGRAKQINVVLIGTNRLNDPESETKSVKERIVHEDFNDSTLKNDIALIKLKSRIQFTAHVYPACISVDIDDLPKGLIVSGWGKTTEYNENGNISLVLKKTSSLETVELKECQKSYRERGSRADWNIIKTQYCARARNHGSDARHGDSGGPLQMLHNSDGTRMATIVGIVSFGPDGPTRYPGVYTRVASFVNWIVDNNVWKK